MSGTSGRRVGPRGESTHMRLLVVVFAALAFAGAAAGTRRRSSGAAQCRGSGCASRSARRAAAGTGASTPRRRPAAGRGDDVRRRPRLLRRTWTLWRTQIHIRLPPRLAGAGARAGEGGRVGPRARRLLGLPPQRIGRSERRADVRLDRAAGADPAAAHAAADRSDPRERLRRRRGAVRLGGRPGPGARGRTPRPTAGAVSHASRLRRSAGRTACPSVAALPAPRR